MRFRLAILVCVVWMAGCVPAQAPSRQDGDPNIQLAIAGAQLTGTAQAWDMQLVAWTVTAQSWTPTASITPSPTLTPTISPTPTVDVTGTMAVEFMNAELADLERQNKRKDATNTVMAWLPYLVFGLFVGLAVFFGYDLYCISERHRVITTAGIVAVIGRVSACLVILIAATGI